MFASTLSPHYCGLQGCCPLACPLYWGGSSSSPRPEAPTAVGGVGIAPGATAQCVPPTPGVCTPGWGRSWVLSAGGGVWVGGCVQVPQHPLSPPPAPPPLPQLPGVRCRMSPPTPAPCPAVSPSVRQSLCAPICPPSPPRTCLPVRLPGSRLSVHPAALPALHQSGQPSVCPARPASICPSVHRAVCPAPPPPPRHLPVQLSVSSCLHLSVFPRTVRLSLQLPRQPPPARLSIRPVRPSVAPGPGPAARGQHRPAAPPHDTSLGGLSSAGGSRAGERGRGGDGTGRKGSPCTHPPPPPLSPPPLPPPRALRPPRACVPPRRGCGGSEGVNGPRVGRTKGLPASQWAPGSAP